MTDPLPWKNRITGTSTADPATLLVNAANPRLHPNEQQDTLTDVLTEVGIVQGVMVNRRTSRKWPKDQRGIETLVDGHLRCELAIERGQAEIPVTYVDLTPEEERLVLATFDPITGMADVDPEKLDALLSEIETESQALRTLMDGLAAEAGIGRVPPPDDPGPQIDRAAELQKKWKVKPGDLFEITGPSGMTHKLLCGDSTVEADVKRLMGGETCDVCFTSPPYAQQRDYTKKIDDWDGLMQGVLGNIPANDKTQVLVNLGFIHRDGEWIPYWDGWIEWMRGQGWKRYGWYVWEKSSGNRKDGCRLPNAHEFIWHFCKHPIEPVKCEPCKTAGRREFKPASWSDAAGQYSAHDKLVTTNQMTVRGSVCHVGRAAEPVEGHPAAYPSRLVTYFIEHWPGTVYDPFLGSGTTLVACEQLGRRGFGIEIAPQYVAVSLERMSGMNCTVKKVPKVRKVVNA